MDPLTGLPNGQTLEDHFTRQTRAASEVSVIVVNLDGLIDLNYVGPGIGDRALIEVARVLRAGIPRSDVCAHVEGGMFVFLRSATGPAEAEQIAQKLRKSVEYTNFEIVPGVRLPLYVSAGTAVFPFDGRTCEELVNTAYGRKEQARVSR